MTINRTTRSGFAPWVGLSLILYLGAFCYAQAGAADGPVTAGAGKSTPLGRVPQLVQAPRIARTAQSAPQAAFDPGGAKTCLDCHDSPAVTSILHTPHAVTADGRTPFAQHQCETCHGASPEHIADPTKPVAIVFGGPHPSPTAERNDTCLSCHSAGLRTHWAGSQHETRGLACSDCHNVHATEQKVLNKATQAEVCFVCHKEQRAQVRRISSHPLATTSLASAPKMVCSDCHNPHGSDGPKLLIKASVNETCYVCHAEKRGPFLWEHAPVVEDCTNCHTPHGSTNASLLKTRPPLLCQQCHTGDHASQINSGANLGGGNVTTLNGAQLPGAASPRVQVAGRACLNCHVLIHGSNHPAGAKFQR